MYSEWIKKGTKKAGKSRAGLARAITEALKLDPPMARTTIYKIIAGTRTIHAEELEPAALYMEEPIPRIADMIVQAEQAAVPVTGGLQVGTWLDPDVTNEDTSSVVVPRDHMFPHATMLAYIVKDDSMDAMKIFEGDIIVCVAFKDAKVKLASGMKVVIERVSSSGLVERTLRKVEITNGNGSNVEFISRCTSKEYKSVSLKAAKSNGERVTVVGILRRSMREYV